MEWVLLALVLLLVLGLVIARAARQRAEAAAALEAAPQDEADLVQTFAVVEQEAGATREKLLAARLEVLRRRQVPLRAVRQAPGSDAARLAFADGTVLIVRTGKPGEVYVMAVALVEHPVCVRAYRREADGTVVRLVWPPRGVLELRVLGLDQAD